MTEDILYDIGECVGLQTWNKTYSYSITKEIIKITILVIIFKMII